LLSGVSSSSLSMSSDVVVVCSTWDCIFRL
jgi:hypothetical protein